MQGEKKMPATIARNTGEGCGKIDEIFQKFKPT